MTHKRNKSGKNLIAAVIFLAAMTLPCGRSLAQQPRGFLQTVHKHVTCTSTIAENGDTNPYAIVVAPVSAGRIHAGDILFDNFNNLSNLQGTGTTIVDYDPKTGKTIQF